MVYKTLKNAGYMSENDDKNQNNITIHELVNSATDGTYDEMIKEKSKKD